MDYFKTDEKQIADLEITEIQNLYENGYVLTRLGSMQQTRSLRIDLKKFELSSENRRVLKKGEELEHFMFDLPLPTNETNWHIHSLGKQFYSEKFNDVTFSANKIRDLLLTKSNKFNALAVYYQNNSLPNDSAPESIDHAKTLGYAICFKTTEMLHYAYPFYDLDIETNISIGMAMMLKAILWAKGSNLKYIYLGSYTRPKDRYKLQFKGLEWWDQPDKAKPGNKTNGQWSNNLDQLKTLV